MTIKKLISPILIFALLAPQIVLAADPFNPNLIISDSQVRDYNSMDRAGIQSFLQKNNSYLANYFAPDATGMLKRAADIIYEAALKSRINPKFLLVLLQKEQSLITDPTPSAKQLDWATGYAVCDSCSMSDPAIQRWKGFGKQVNSAALQFADYMENPGQYTFRPGNTYTITNTNKPASTVTVQNLATAALYNYTPHVYNGNYNFHKLWNNWFIGEFFPNGTIAKSTLMDSYYLIQDGQLRRFKNKTVLLSRANPTAAIPLTPEDLSKYATGPDINFANYSLLKSGATTYLVDHDTIRPFDSETTFRYFGYHPDEVIEVASADLAGYKIGEKITRDLIAPLGIIYEVPELATNYLLKDGILYPITNPLVIKANYKDLPREKHEIADLKKFIVASLPVTFNDGVLLQETDSQKLYVMENGKKRRIKDMTSFLAMGYKKENLITIDLLTAFGIPNGDSFYIENRATGDTQIAEVAPVVTGVKEMAEISPSPVAPVAVRAEYIYDTATPQDLFKTEIPTYLVAEYPNGKILTGKNIDAVRSIASLNKLMTAQIAIDQGFNLRETTTYYRARHANYGNPLKLTDGEQLKNIDLLNTLLVASINPVARMIAQNKMSEENFIKKMNIQAKEWGLNKTKFADVSGLSEDNKSTARNLLKLFVEVLKKPEIKAALGDTEYVVQKINAVGEDTFLLKNTNHLILNPKTEYKIVAGKTGYTDEAQSVLIQLITNPNSGKQFITITMGNTDYTHRFDEPDRLAKWTVKNY